MNATDSSFAEHRPGPEKFPTVVQVLARKNSSRTKDKNIREVCGLPLIAYSILVAKAVPSVDRVIINTDSERYADMAKEFGAEALFIRPPRLASASSGFDDVICHAISYFSVEEGCVPLKLISLVPTSPFRNVKALEGMVAGLDKFRWVKTAAAIDADWNRVAIQNGSGAKFVAPYLQDNDNASIPTKGTGYFSGMCLSRWENGPRFMLHPEEKHIMFCREKSLVEKNFLKMFRIKNPIELIDIDHEEDLALMEAVLKKRLYDFGVDLC